MSRPASMRPALFLDRDGVLNEEVGYLHRFQDVRWVPGAVGLVSLANRLRLPVIVVTNQAGIGRGLYTEADFHQLMRQMSAALAEQGAHLDAAYFSPYHPEHGIGPYKRDSDCRKPGPGMLVRAAREHRLSLPESVLVGDRCSDLQAGAAAGLTHLFLLRGTIQTCPEAPPHHAVDTLEAVRAWLLNTFSQ